MLGTTSTINFEKSYILYQCRKFWCCTGVLDRYCSFVWSLWFLWMLLRLCTASGTAPALFGGRLNTTGCERLMLHCESLGGLWITDCYDYKMWIINSYDCNLRLRMLPCETEKTKILSVERGGEGEGSYCSSAPCVGVTQSNFRLRMSPWVLLVILLTALYQEI